MPLPSIIGIPGCDAATGPVINDSTRRLLIVFRSYADRIRPEVVKEA
ncbi:hypothetical protein [Streptosporangium roseum]|uniref:Uncharacterized protein n=1 Tax=Streptosporangium roseum (strain ATCC 12428 / DSM 43021 / JCM 3005 / KCTC 9067 / NCIMB 10171 / NRRL 2505 / NI 9100) TaxID=479432 RepID=D2B0K4_STRRD|nr:hypothetical protein [Streptosporangium roseum]ACZ91016.1 hypothetical protein Sros_8370 [Streptosporangium roseum DSM 43021]